MYILISNQSTVRHKSPIFIIAISPCHIEDHLYRIDLEVRQPHANFTHIHTPPFCYFPLSPFLIRVQLHTSNFSVTRGEGTTRRGEYHSSHINALHSFFHFLSNISRFIEIVYVTLYHLNQYNTLS